MLFAAAHIGPAAACGGEQLHNLDSTGSAQTSGTADSMTAPDPTETSGAATTTSNSSSTADTTSSDEDTTADGDTTGGHPTIDCTLLDCRYVLASAPPGGDGSSWIDATIALPDELERGAVYFVGAGAYPAYTFDDAPSGDLVTTVVKATLDDHGTDVGWDDAYGAAQASFDSALVIEQGSFVFDGRVRDELDWFDGDAYGFRIAHAEQDQNIIIADYGVSIDHVEIRHVFVDAIVENLPDVTIRRYAIDTDGFDGGSTATNLRFHRMYVRGSNNVWFLRTTSGAIVEYCASDGAAGNAANHGEIVNLYYSGSDAIVRHNRWRNAFLGPGGLGTALVAITQADGLQFYGNVAWDFAVGDGAIGFDGFASSGNRVHHNTFVGNMGFNAGTAFGDGTDNLVYNNLWVDAGTVNLAGLHDFNGFGDDSDRGEANAQLGVTRSIFVDPDAGDFHLVRNTAPGMPLGRPWDVDADGDPRTTPSRGAYEY